MKKRIFLILAAFSALLLLVTAALYFSVRQSAPGNAARQDAIAAQLIALNEIEQLARAGQLDTMSEKAAALRVSIRSLPPAADNPHRLLLLCAVCIVCLAVAFAYIYFSILRPFDKLSRFAKEISGGNFDLPLNYERSNYFGAFTWAFDSMRREITKARACEREAIENNKTVIATLSHDIKTPIASIRAYAEGLEANMENSPEKRARYLGVIMKKCDEVSRLTNDLFLHSLADLDKLKLSPAKTDLGALLVETVEELAAEQGDLHFTAPPYAVFAFADKNRLVQAVENLINNARKYARTDIDISLRLCGQEAELCVRDYGPGIPDEEIPFVFDKFYRGKNHGGEPGAGLGLYIVKYITEQLGGRILLENYSDGLEVKLLLPAIRGDS
ncbi:MAG: HAMP domain-containing histidine kinase [Lachnospiraceae bacterium]|nr:HAMP domain-containing histidine kinase [Lachnospiraceae bacterium]